MSKEQNREENIKRYLDGILNDEETNAMSDSISSDKQLAHSVEEQKVLLDGIKYSGRNKLKAKFAEWDTAIEEPDVDQQGTQRTFRIPRFAIAASISLAIISGIVVYNYIGSGNERIVASYFEPIELDNGARRGAKTEANAETVIFEDYMAGKYALTIERIQEIETGQRSELMQMALANAFLAEQRPNEAIPILEDLSDNSRSFSPAARWYLSLALLMNEDVQASTEILTDLAKIKSSYASKAQKLLDDLN